MFYKEDRYKYEEIEKQSIQNAKDIIAILNDMVNAVFKNYTAKKMHRYRELCFGYLLICKRNIEATVCLAEENLVHPIHYISRNMFEMVLNLYYIDDDEHMKNEKVNRYYEYNDSIKRKQAKKVVHKYPEIFGAIELAAIDKQIDQKVQEFRDKYKRRDGKKINEKTWSGLTMPQMIETIKDKDLKGQLIREYEVMITANNNYLHPTVQYTREMLKEFDKREKNNKYSVMQVISILSPAYMIIEKFLSQFSKGRPVFRERLSVVFDKVADHIMQEKK